MTQTSWLNVDLSALQENVRSIRRWAGADVGLCAIVKADAYGLGCVPVARHLEKAEATMLAVYNGDQARQLVEAGIRTPLLVLMPIHELPRTDLLYRSAVSGQLHLTVHSHDHADQVEQIGMDLGTVLPIHIEIDTGMSRCGMGPQQAVDLLGSLPGRRWLKLSGIFTHPASADTDPVMTDRQLTELDAVLHRCEQVIGPDAVIHFANTHAMLRDRRYHRQMMRVGLAMYGLGGADLAGGDTDRPVLRPVASWFSRIAHLREVPAGSPVGYNGTFTTWRHSRLAVAPIGYADGYPVSLSNRAIVRVGDNLKHAPVRGKVSMDQLTIDVTDIPEAQLGSTVEIYSAQPDAPNSVANLAALARTHCYEMLCRISSRIEKNYLSDTTDNSLPINQIDSLPINP